MTPQKLFRYSAFFAGLLLSATAHAQGIEIKGLRIGMTIDEIENKIGRLPVRDFTIGGVPSKDPVSLIGNFIFRDKKLAFFRFAFRPSEFDEVVSAVKDKYPALICSNTTVTNAMGAAFKQTSCLLKDDELNTLVLTRYASEITTSSLTLTSSRLTEEFLQERNKRKKDL